MRAAKLYRDGLEIDTVLVDQETLRLLSSKTGVEILKLLNKKTAYPADIAETIGVSKQLVSTYVRRMFRAGLVDKVGEREIRGGRATLYRSNVRAAAIVIDRKGWAKTLGSQPLDRNLASFLGPLVENGTLNGLIVVGSPHPHGPLQATASDGHYGFQLGLFLGRYVRIPREFKVRLDVDVKAERLYGENMVLLGGPGTNVVTAMINKYMPASFMESNYWAGITSPSRIYTNEFTGLIVKIPNPFSEGRTIIVLAGLRSVGTKAAVMMLTADYERLLDSYRGEERWAAIIQGRDLDGDGRIDSTDILELVPG
ncbi:MAG: ArsR family transcriptional regulator [Nitrososphaerota archaeon]